MSREHLLADRCWELKKERDALQARLDAAEADRGQALEALRRLASQEGFVAIGTIPDDIWGEELRQRGLFAQAMVDGLARPGDV